MNRKPIHSQQILRSRRQELRNLATPGECLLWEKLRKRQLDGYKFQRQHSIGIYIIDFYCPKSKLAIEIDGMQHVNNIDYDLERTEYLNKFGIKVLRFWNYEIKNDITKVLGEISINLK